MDAWNSVADVCRETKRIFPPMIGTLVGAMLAMLVVLGSKNTNGNEGATKGSMSPYGETINVPFPGTVGWVVNIKIVDRCSLFCSRTVLTIYFSPENKLII